MPEDRERAGPLKDRPISRRQFALRAALASAATTLAPGALLTEVAPPAPLPQQSAGAPALSPESRAEVEARVQSILERYGNRFTGEQKAEIRRLAGALQAPLDSLRTYPLSNGVSPALYLKPLVEREKRPTPPQPAAKRKS